MSELAAPGSADGRLTEKTPKSEPNEVELLYRHGAGGVMVSLLASSGLAMISAGQVSRGYLAGWWATITALLLLRAIDILRFHLRGSWAGSQARWSIGRFGAGLVPTAILWALFPLLFFRALNDTGRAYTAIVLSGMAGGGATVLASSKSLSLFFSALLVLPTAISFLLTPGKQNLFLGVLGCVFFLVMSISSRVTNRVTMTAIELSRANGDLAREMGVQRQRTEAANVELHEAQTALQQANQFLEERIAARTADLEKVVREKECFAKELANLARTDALTGLSNRTALVARLTGAIGRAEQAGRRVAVFFLDLDRFKEVNDVMGHAAGDFVLRAIARRLSAALPAGVELARWGGDEFVIVHPGIDHAEAAIELAQTLRNRLFNPIETESGVVAIDGTFGIALFPQHGRTQEELVRAADLAMYSGKEEKRSRIRLFDHSISAKVNERSSMERALREAISTESLSLVFQPIVTASDKSCVALEALLRWNHPSMGVIPPSVFIPLAERTGEIASIGRWVLQEACREAASWELDEPPSVSVNVSAAQVESGTLVSDVDRALKKAGLPASRLHLELTESVFAGECSSISPTLQELRTAGAKIALDDFGTGFSCLAYLRELPIDAVKIDRSFVRTIHIDSAPIVETIVKTAKTFGLQVVAEGVETEAQAETLAQMGVHYLQGHLFADALPATMVGEWLRARQAVSGASLFATTEA